MIKQLKEFIDKIPPFEKLQKISENNINNISNNIVNISINVTNACNLSCEYCIANCNIQQKQYIYIDLNYLYNYIQYIHNNIYQNKTINIILFGGEPTLHQDLLSFCKKISNFNWITLVIVSNFTKDINYFLQFKNIKNILFIFSWHSQNKNFLKNAINLFNADNIFFKKIIFAIMYEHQNIKLSKLIYMTLSKLTNNIYMSLLDIEISEEKNHLHRKLFKYTIEQIEDLLTYCNLNDKVSMKLIFENNIIYISETCYKLLIYYKYINFKKLRCLCKYESLFINEYGKVYYCINDYLINKNPIGSIYNQSISNISFSIIKCCNACLQYHIAKIK